jgi:hypothetical protein
MYRRAALSATLLLATSLTACPAAAPEGDDAGGVTPERDTGATPDATSEDTGGPDPTNNTTGCVDVTVYADSDGDGFGTGEATTECLPGGQPTDGFALRAGDCNDSDPLQFQGSEGVCNDNVDDDCDQADEVCPESRPDQVTLPDWDCTGDPPPSVYAWARFDDGGEYFAPGGCFVFFEGGKDVFYSTRVNLERADPCPDELYGCTCPSLGSSPSFDRRLYAFTLAGDVDGCDEIELVDHAGEEQPVSNSCRKYLYQLHRYDIAYSHVATTVDALERRLSAFPSVEIACLRDAPHRSLPFASLLTTTIERNPNFAKQ